MQTLPNENVIKTKLCIGLVVSREIFL